ncbi:hypothetical protein LTR62_004357 [Meristemomyces frigidus]|uniref:Uncharacterized protein n=1 Tax=Meristemomyces frigidus TaxID=1508187 RepID=A0AAN7TMN8_9PEZI|nr:hypothetical protein LTR62_004357 [Meristemomyces frigidus]
MATPSHARPSENLRSAHGAHQATKSSANFHGIDFNCTDGTPEAPTTKDFDPAETQDEIIKWFGSHPDGEAPALRLIVAKLPCPHSDRTSWKPEIPFRQDILEYAIWQHSAYTNLLPSRGGGCAALLDEPVCFVLQTPVDLGPFCSLAMSKRGIVVKGIFLYRASLSADGEAYFDPLRMMENETVISGWRSTGMQIIALPIAVAKSHALYITRELDDLASMLSTIEAELSSHTIGTRTEALTPLTRTLQTTTSRLLAAERRINFQTSLLSAIETVTSSHKRNTPTWPPLAPLKNNLESWSHDLSTIPRRVSAAQGTIQTLIQHHNEALNLDIATSSHRMMEAALKDNATMKTIAIMTMIFLPSTAVASFFSMGMFDWGASGGRGGAEGQVVSKWLWIFFVIAVPLTGLVIGLWWVWLKRHERRIGRMVGDGSAGDGGVGTEAAGGARTMSDDGFRDEVEMERFCAGGKANDFR